MVGESFTAVSIVATRRGATSLEPVTTVGAPGIAPRGAVATVFDDLFGFLLYSVGDLAVTCKFEVEYVCPELLEVEYRLQRNLGEYAGRKGHMAGSLHTSDGALVARAGALFVTVDVEHFRSQRRS